MGRGPALPKLREPRVGQVGEGLPGAWQGLQSFGQLFPEVLDCAQW